ncbi:MAG: ABC transporter ATP-binding protein [Dehalococcoidia bacterium]|nr:ABC transporter ATP-binding protein [Dehalococcoidia bacterium]
MIRAQQLEKRFGPITAVSDVSLEVAEGKILALLGPNGAGKTTTVRMLCSLLKPTNGNAFICGYDTVTEAKTVRGLVGLLTEMPGLYGRLNAIEYLEFFGKLQSVPENTFVAISRRLLEYFDLWEQRGRPIATFSKGMKQKLSLARALIHSPKVLLLDEPTSAMDPYSAKTVRDYIRDLKKDGRAIILCTHNLAEAEELADQIAIIQHGRTIAIGTAEQLKCQFLGPPSYEAHFAKPVNESVVFYNGIIKIEEWSPHQVRYSTLHPEVANPAYISHLVASGAELIRVAEAPRRLEDVYLKVTGLNDR